MTNLPVLIEPNIELRKQSHSVAISDIESEQVQTLIDDLIETMGVENGVGIAAPQVGVQKRIIIVDVDDEPIALINPKITSRSLRKINFEEGCLSVPGIYGIVRRHKIIKVKALDRHGNQLAFRAVGLLSVVLQHETDHLDGILFIDRTDHFINRQRL